MADHGRSGLRPDCHRCTRRATRRSRRRSSRPMWWRRRAARSSSRMACRPKQRRRRSTTSSTSPTPTAPSWTRCAASAFAPLAAGMEDMGVKKNEVMVFSELMDAKSLFLTPNADTIYVMGWLDLSDGPVVIESPPEFLGIVQDAWFHWVTDMGSPGPDRGLGGKYLIVPPGYEASCPRAATSSPMRTRPASSGSAASFLKDGSDPKPSVDVIKAQTKVYPLRAGRRRHLDRGVPRRRRPAREDHRAAGDRLPRGERQGDEHASAERLELLRASERGGAGRARDRRSTSS